MRRPDGTESEEWLPVVGREGAYAVSSLGRARSLPRVIVTRSGVRRRLPGCLLTPYTGGEYPTVTFGQDGKQYIHVLVAHAFLGPCPPGQEVRHRDGDKSNPAASNLRYGTPSENQHDSVEHGTHVQSRKVRCPLAHRLVTPNLTASGARGGRRGCLACDRGRSNVRRAVERGEVLDLRTAADRHYATIMEGTVSA